MAFQLIRPAGATSAACGPKAAVLARALEVGLPVPPFVVIPAEAYRSHIECALPAAAAPDPAIVRRAISAAPLEAGLLAALAAELEAISPRVAVRSSGLAEDLPGLSFAGQYESVLDVAAEDIPAAVLACWASAWSDRAVAYRERNDMSANSAAMAVIVQRFVPSALGGVAFTADPVTGSRSVVVESSAEGAEAIVSGRVSPARETFERDALTEPDGTAAVTAEDPADVPRAAALLALAAERLLDAPADIEWAWDGEQLWLLQARPITTVVAPTPRYRPTAWSNVNTGEVLPEVVTPMTWSIIGKLVTGLVDSIFGKLGIRIEHARLTSLIGGRAYFNASLLASAFAQIPMAGGEDITTIFGGGAAPPGFADLPIAPEDTAHLSKLRLVAGLPLLAVWFARHSPKHADRFCARMRARARAGLDRIDGARTEDELYAAAADTVTALESVVDAIAFSGVAMAYHGRFLGLMRRHFGAEGSARANTMLTAQGGVASADSGLALARLAHLARSNVRLSEALTFSARWAEVRPRLEFLGRDGAAFLAAWDAFLVEHGHHARGELEFASPRWAECPDDVLAMVTTLLGATGDDDLITAYERRAVLAAEEERRVLDGLGPVARFRLRSALWRARGAARVRENAKNDGVRMLAVTRRALLALGEAMAERGALSSAEDILFLEWDEVAPVRSGELVAAPLVAARRAEFEANRLITPPGVVIGEWDGRPVGVQSEPAAESDTLTGLGVASGLARGRARVIHSLQSAERVLPGEVLVAPVTDPGWTPYFVPAAAIIVDMGGMLSHGSIIAREYGIPGVVNVGRGTTAIRTGDLVEVDGSRGIVRVIERCG